MLTLFEAMLMEMLNVDVNSGYQGCAELIFELQFGFGFGFDKNRGFGFGSILSKTMVRFGFIVDKLETKCKWYHRSCHTGILRSLLMHDDVQ